MTLRLKSDKTTKTIKTTLEVELIRQETITEVTCRCGRKGECRTVTVKPPAAIGSPVTYHRVPDGWWTHGNSLFNVKASCPSCFETAPSGVLLCDNEDED